MRGWGVVKRMGFDREDGMWWRRRSMVEKMGL